MEKSIPLITGLVGRTRLIATLIILLATALDLLDTTIINVAIPTIQHGLHTSYSMIQWLLVGYTLSFAVLLITGGRMGDIFGYKRLFMVGASLFGVASLFCGFAPTIGMLIALRVVQGAAAALMVPQATSLIQLMYTPSERSKVMGIFGAIGGLSAVLGPLIGGALLHANIGGHTWRPLFFINVPVSLVALIAGYFLLPSGKSPRPLKLDLVGTALITTALTLFVLPLIEGRDQHWPVWTGTMLVGSLPFFVAFIWQQRRKNRRNESALVEASLFHHATFAQGLLLNIIFEIMLGGLLLTFTLALQQGLGYSALKAAITGLPMIVGIVLGVAVFGELLIPKIGRYIVTLGATVMSIGMLVTAWVFNHYGAGVHAWQFAPSLFVTGLGMGLLSGPLFAITLQHVDKAHAGSGSGILEAAEQLGSVFGVVIIGALFFDHVSSGFARAYTWGIIGCVVFATGLFILSFRLPRRFKTEEELGIEGS